MKNIFKFASQLQPKKSVTMMMRCRLLASILGIVWCIESSNAMRGERPSRWKDPWLEKIDDETDARYVIVTPHTGNGKGGKGTSDSDDVGFGFPTIAPKDTASGSTNPPVVTPSASPVVAPSISPTKAPPQTSTPAPSVTSGATAPTNVPPTTVPPTTSNAGGTESPTTLEQNAACEAAANGDVYATEESITVRFLYELLSPANRSITEVASNVDAKVQDFLVTELVNCDNPSLLSTIGGVGRGEIGTIVESICSKLIPSEDSETCNLMAGTVHLYLFSSGTSNDEEVSVSGEEGLSQVEQKLKIAFNGERRSLQTSLVDETQGILGLYYIGGRVDEEEKVEDGTPETGGGDITGIVSGSRDTSSSVVPAAVVPAVLAVCVASLVAAFFVFRRRRRRTYDPARGLLLEDDESSLGEKRWEGVKTSNALQVKVVETTDDSESGSSGAAAAAAHEVVMADLTGMTVSESLSGISFIKPVFIDPDSVTLYTNSPRVRYKERDYFVDDTIDI